MQEKVATSILQLLGKLQPFVEGSPSPWAP